ncbi:hypothetical protein M0R45_032604 [Rubus argutus]|uniref:Uncharacterized protein n=1 Tax=Rubus argutus TaxID=59490 RepID=A0AAW1WIH8_RUBAR
MAASPLLQSHPTRASILPPSQNIKTTHSHQTITNQIPNQLVPFISAHNQKHPTHQSKNLKPCALCPHQFTATRPQHNHDTIQNQNPRPQNHKPSTPLPKITIKPAFTVPTAHLKNNHLPIPQFHQPVLTYGVNPTTKQNPTPPISNAITISPPPVSPLSAKSHRRRHSRTKQSRSLLSSLSVLKSPATQAHGRCSPASADEPMNVTPHQTQP